MNGGSVRFLSLDNVLHIHADTIAREGGSHGTRDRGLPESAVAMPQAAFGGEYLHPGLAAKAAAYLFHLCQNHPFIEGNKRVAAFSSVLFLALNGIPDESLPLEDDLERVTLAVASGKMGKEKVTVWLSGLGFE